jgi:transcriptional regulator with XRE-family HTH domain
MIDVVSVIEKLKNALKISSDKELANLLDISYKTVAAWKQRKTLDFKKIIELAITYGVDLNYLFLESVKEEKSDKPSEFEEYVIYQLRKIKKLDRNNIFLFFNPTFEFLTRCLKQTDDFDFSQLNKKNAKSVLISFIRKCKKNVFLDSEMKRDKLVVEIEEEFSNIECYVLLKFKEYFL